MKDNSYALIADEDSLKPSRSVSFLLRLAWRDLRANRRHLWIFWTCLMLGVTLIAASGGLLRQVSAGLLADTRALFGGDLEIETRTPLGDTELEWIQARGEVSLLVELRTMMLAGDRPRLVELQSVDENYPLYGVVELEPEVSVAHAVAFRDGVWGVALDPVLAQRLALDIGDTVSIGEHEAEVRALIRRQPDRSLNANWRGPPVLISSDALASSGLIMPGSRLEYEYRIKVSEDPDHWGESLVRAFPQAEFEVQSFTSRRGRIAEVLDQVSSGLLLIGFSALFIGGLGVFNSVRAYLESKLATIATLRTLGLRDGMLAGVYLMQVLLLAASAALVGTAIGGTVAYMGAQAAAEYRTLTPDPRELIIPLGIAWAFGVLTALGFALPAVGQALSVRPAVLFRGIDNAVLATPVRWWRWTVACGVVTALLVLWALPQPGFGIFFVLCVTIMLLLLETLVRVTRRIATRIAGPGALEKFFVLKLAIANVQKTRGALRVTLLSLGSALTLLVASAVVVMALLKTIDETVPDQAPALVLYDISPAQTETLRAITEQAESLERLDLVPLVLGRLSHVNADALSDSAEGIRVLESSDEHKLTHRLNNIDAVTITKGQWWPADYAGPPLVAFEDREANQLGLEVGDRLRFRVMGDTLDAVLAAIYSQRGIGTRFWFEGIFSDGALDRYITRYVGTAYLDHTEAIEIEAAIAAAIPNVVIIRTQQMLNEARSMLAQASIGLSVVGGITLLASLLVLISVGATSRTRHVYEATVLHTLGTRFSDIRRSIMLEYFLIAVLTSIFALAIGTPIAATLLHTRFGLDMNGVWWVGILVALVISTLALNLSARTFLGALRVRPVTLLRS